MALNVQSPEAPPIVLPSTGVKADVYLQCLTTVVMGGNGLSRPGGNLGLRIWGLGLAAIEGQSEKHLSPRASSQTQPKPCTPMV